MKRPAAINKTSPDITNYLLHDILYLNGRCSVKIGPLGFDPDFHLPGIAVIHMDCHMDCQALGTARQDTAIHGSPQSMCRQLTQERAPS